MILRLLQLVNTRFNDNGASILNFFRSFCLDAKRTKKSRLQLFTGQNMFHFLKETNSNKFSNSISFHGNFNIFDTRRKSNVAGSSLLLNLFLTKNLINPKLKWVLHKAQKELWVTSLLFYSRVSTIYLFIFLSSWLKHSVSLYFYVLLMET